MPMIFSRISIDTDYRIVRKRSRRCNYDKHNDVAVHLHGVLASILFYLGHYHHDFVTFKKIIVDPYIDSIISISTQNIDNNNIFI